MVGCCSSSLWGRLPESFPPGASSPGQFGGPATRDSPAMGSGWVRFVFDGNGDKRVRWLLIAPGLCIQCSGCVGDLRVTASRGSSGMKPPSLATTCGDLGMIGCVVVSECRSGSMLNPEIFPGGSSTTRFPYPGQHGSTDTNLSGSQNPHSSGQSTDEG